MKKITFFFWDGWLDVSPTLLSMLTYCSKKEFEVDFIIRDNCVFELHSIEYFKSDKIRFHNVETKNWISNLCLVLITKIESLIRHTKTPIFIKIFYHVIYQLKYFSNFIELKKFQLKINRFKIKSKQIGIFIDTNSLISCSKKLKEFEHKYYLSLEILGKSISKYDWLNKILKKKESYILNHAIDLIIIQDEVRHQQLCDTLNLSKEINSFYLPNSIFKDQNDLKSDFFREKFNINKNDTVLLAAGMISEYVSSLEIACVMGKQDKVNNIKTIFHNRIKDDFEVDYLSKIRSVSNDNVILSLDPVPFNELYKIYSSIDIGLVIYNTKIEDLNYTEIGSASGKLFQFAKFGIPVIASNLKGLSNLVLKYELGVLIDSISEIPEATKKILENYGHYSKSSKNAFENYFSMDIILQKIL